MPTFTISGRAGSLHVVDLREESPTPSGSPPVVFVHGMVGHTGFWNPALAACADVRRAVAVDLRGHGSSSAASDGDYSIQGCASDVLAAIDTLSLETVVLVGHSYGACVVTEVAATRPKRVRRVVLIDPPGDFTRVSNEIRDTQLLPFIDTLQTDHWREAVEKTFDQALGGSTISTAASIRARLASTPRETMLSMYQSMMNYSTCAALERYLSAHSTSVHAILAPANAWPFSLHVLMPAIRTTTITGVGHWIMLDAPDRFVTALTAALDGA